jgi:hypothetical protein
MPQIRITAGGPMIAPGTYNATLVGCEDKHLVTKFTGEDGDDFLEWTWAIEGPQGDVEITSLTSLSTAPKSTMFSYLVAMLGASKAQVGADFDTDRDLVGKRVMVGIITTDEGFSKINGVMAAPVGRQPSNLPTPDAARAQFAAVISPDDDALPF